MHRFARPRRAALAAVPAMLLASPGLAPAQTIDCGQLRAQIARLDRGGGRSAGAARRQAAELARDEAQAQQIGCGGGLASFFGGGDPRCGALTQRIQQLQASVGQMQAGGGGGLRADLAARFNAYCRGGQPQPQQSKGFFDSLFDTIRGEPQPQAPAPDAAPRDDGRGADDGDGDKVHAHGGGQAVCVRTCDGGFFPLGVSARRDGDELKQMCQALCPGTETEVFTRNPDLEINTAVGLDGRPYMDMPNALKFSKAVEPSCSCRPPGKSWAETLANAEDVIGNTRKGDIVVTQAKSDEMSRPRMDAKTRASMLAGPPPAAVAPETAARIAGDAADNDSSSPPETAATDGTARAVRRVGPQP